MVSNMIYGYARISTKEQKLDRQIDSLTKYVDIKNIYSDKLSGKNTNRKNYQKLKELVVAGDIVYIHALDRLSRNKRDTIREFNYFKEKGVILRILNMPTTLIELDGQQWVIEMINNIILEVLSSVAEQERITTLERQREGIEAARMRGVRFGRPRKEIPENFEILKHQWQQNLIASRQAAKELGVSQDTFLRWAHGK